MGPQATCDVVGPVFHRVTGHQGTAGARDDGSDVALTSLVARSSEGLLRTAYLLCLDLDLAEDLVVRTWTEVARQWTAEVPRSAARPDTWAERLLVAAAIETQAARQPARGTEGRGPLPSRSLVGRSGALALQQVEDRLEVEFALNTLSPHQRAVLVLRHHGGLTAEETATAIGCSVSTVECTTHHLVHPGEAAEELLTETFAWQAAAVDTARVDAVTRRDYEPRRGAMSRVGTARSRRRWPRRGWLAGVLARRRGARR